LEKKVRKKKEKSAWTNVEMCGGKKTVKGRLTAKKKKVLPALKTCNRRKES